MDDHVLLALWVEIRVILVCLIMYLVCMYGNPIK